MGQLGHFFLYINNYIYNKEREKNVANLKKSVPLSQKHIKARLAGALRWDTFSGHFCKNLSH